MIFYFVKTLFTRSYHYLFLTFFSLFVGAFLFGAILSLSTSISSYFISQGKVLIGGDIVLQSGRTIDATNSFFTALTNSDHTITTEYELQTVFRNASGSSTLAASVRAVDKQFPLYGNVLLENNLPFKVDRQSLYAERSFLDKLGVTVGDKVYIGTSSFVVSGVLQKIPDEVSFGVSFSPKVIISREGIQAASVDLSQSRVSYKVSIKQNPLTPLTSSDIATIATYAKENKLRFDDARDGPNSFVRGLSSVQDFAGIVLAIALFLVAVNIGANLTYILSRFKKTIALLKTYGATTTQIRSIYFIILGTVGLIAGSLGAVCGGYGAMLLLPYISIYIEGSIPSTSLLFIMNFGGVSGLILIIISSIPFFNSLSFVTPKQLLSSIAPTSTKNAISFIGYIPLPVFLGVLLFGISKNIMLTLYGVGGLVLLFVFYMVLTYICIRYLYAVRTHFSFVVSSIISFLKWRGLETIVTTASVMTALSGVFIVSAIEQNIVTNVQGSISKTVPALYLVDITTSQLPKVKEIAGPTFKEYPIIRGRLLSINNKDMTTSSDREVTREFNMTYRSTLIDGESIHSGIWHGDSKTQNALSFEKSFADQVGGVVLGDVVTVFIQGITIKATVTSIHIADKSKGTPFFYMVFSPDVLEKFPASYFGTVEENATTIRTIETTLGSLYPNIIPIQTGRILEIINTLLETIVLIVKIIGIPSIILGLLLVLVMTGQSLYERKGDVLVLRAFGLTKSTITTLFILEASSLIFLATGISYGIAHIIAYILNRTLFSFTLFSFAVTPLYISVGILVVTILYSYYISYSLVQTPLRKLLSESKQ